MINPNKLERGKGIITAIPKGLYQVYTVTLENGHNVYGYDLPERFKLGDKVSIRCTYSITGQYYLISKDNGIRKQK